MLPPTVKGVEIVDPPLAARGDLNKSAGESEIQTSRPTQVRADEGLYEIEKLIRL